MGSDPVRVAEPTKEQLAQMLREYPTWGHAAVAERERAENAYKLLLDVEGSILAYWTDIPQIELQRLQGAIRQMLGGWEAGAA